MFDQVNYVGLNVMLSSHSVDIVLLNDIYLEMKRCFAGSTVAMVVVMMTLFQLQFDSHGERLSAMMEYRVQTNLGCLMIVVVGVDNLREFSFVFQLRFLMFHRLDQ